MVHPAAESESDAPRLNFGRRLKLEFHSFSVTSDAGLLAYRELDDVLGFTPLAGAVLPDGPSRQEHAPVLTGLLRQSVFGRLAGYEDVNDADRLACDPAMRWIVGGRLVHGCAASTSQMGRFETRRLAAEKNLSALADLAGQWIDRVHAPRPSRGILLDMDSSVSPTHGEQENVVTNMARPAENVVAFYNKRGTCEQWIKEGKGGDQVDAAVVQDVRGQCRASPASCARLQSRQLPAHAGDARAD